MKKWVHFLLILTLVPQFSCRQRGVTWDTAGDRLSIISGTTNPSVGVSTTFSIRGGAPPFQTTLTGLGNISLVDPRTILFQRPWTTGSSQIQVSDSLGFSETQSINLIGGAVQLGGGGTPLSTPLFSFIDSGANLYLAGTTEATLGGYQFGISGIRFAYVTKITSAGEVSWISQIGAGPASNVVVAQILLDNVGNTYLLGSTDGSLGGRQYGVTGLLDSFVAKFSTTGLLLWVSQIGGGSGRTTNPINMTFDTSGNILVAGQTDGDLGGVQIGTRGTQDSYIAKLTSDGVLSWVDQVGAGAGAMTSTVNLMVDSLSNILVLGSTQGLLGGIVAGTHGGQDSFVYKLSPTGALVWRTQLGGGGVSLTYPTRFQQDASGVTYISGVTEGTLGGFQSGTHGAQDLFQATLSTTGSLNWVHQLGGGGVTNTVAVDSYVDSSGNSYLTGTTEADLTPTSTLYGVRGITDTIILRISSAGALSWLTQHGNSNVATPSVLTVGPTSVSVVGISAGSLGGIIFGTSGSQDSFAIRLSTAGALSWTAQWGGGGISATLANQARLDATENLYVSGSTTGNLGATMAGIHGATDAFIIKVNSAGSLGWLTQLGAGGTAQTYTSQLLLDTTGNVFLMGRSTRLLQGPITGPANYENSYLAKFNSNGVFQ